MGGGAGEAKGNCGEVNCGFVGGKVGVLWEVKWGFMGGKVGVYKGGWSFGKWNGMRR